MQPLKWRNVPPQDLFLYARTFHKAAKTLAEAPEFDSGPFTDLAACCPVVFMYRHALELHLKAIVLGDGGNFLATKPDPLSICKTHSVVWLAQFVAQIVTALKWEHEFRCAGIEHLDDFRVAVEEAGPIHRAPAGATSKKRCESRVLLVAGEHEENGATEWQAAHAPPVGCVEQNGTLISARLIARARRSASLRSAR